MRLFKLLLAVALAVFAAFAVVAGFVVVAIGTLSALVLSVLTGRGRTAVPSRSQASSSSRPRPGEGDVIEVSAREVPPDSLSP